jgi:hypothetical protein
MDLMNREDLMGAGRIICKLLMQITLSELVSARAYRLTVRLSALSARVASAGLLLSKPARTIVSSHFRSQALNLALAAFSGLRFASGCVGEKVS